MKQDKFNRLSTKLYKWREIEKNSKGELKLFAQAIIHKLETEIKNL